MMPFVLDSTVSREGCGASLCGITSDQQVLYGSNFQVAENSVDV
jgi:hypothetical protein